VDRPTKRKHRSTGKKPPGGPRKGSGRPEGTPNTLEYGEVKAVKVSGLRIPEGTPEAHVELADRALEKIVDIMEGRVSYLSASHVLKAATRLREEVCGPIAQKHEVSGSVSIRVIDPYAEGG
jgi:hypothetical protein